MSMFPSLICQATVCRVTGIRSQPSALLKITWDRASHSAISSPLPLWFRP